MNNQNTLTITIPPDLAGRLQKEATGLRITQEQRVLDILEGAVAPVDNFADGQAAKGLLSLKSFLERIPGIAYVAVSDPFEPFFWAKFQIDITSPIAWHVVQYLGFVLNYISIEEPLPTVFRPVSAPPYTNGGPNGFLSWVIEAKIPFLSAEAIAGFLESRLPNPVEDEKAWLEIDDEDWDE